MPRLEIKISQWLPVSEIGEGEEKGSVAGYFQLSTLMGFRKSRTQVRNKWQAGQGRKANPGGAWHWLRAEAVVCVCQWP